MIFKRFFSWSRSLGKLYHSRSFAKKDPVFGHLSIISRNDFKQGIRCTFSQSDQWQSLPVDPSSSFSSSLLVSPLHLHQAKQSPPPSRWGCWSRSWSSACQAGALTLPPLLQQHFVLQPGLRSPSAVPQRCEQGTCCSKCILVHSYLGMLQRIFFVLRSQVPALLPRAKCRGNDAVVARWKRQSLAHLKEWEGWK